MEGHAVKYRGRQVFFVRAGRHFCDVIWGQGVVRHKTGTYEGAHDAARVGSSARSRFLVGEEAWREMLLGRAIGKNRVMASVVCRTGF